MVLDSILHGEGLRPCVRKWLEFVYLWGCSGEAGELFQSRRLHLCAFASRHRASRTFVFHVGELVNPEASHAHTAPPTLPARHTPHGNVHDSVAFLKLGPTKMKPHQMEGGPIAVEHDGAGRYIHSTRSTRLGHLSTGTCRLPSHDWNLRACDHGGGALRRLLSRRRYITCEGRRHRQNRAH